MMNLTQQHIDGLFMQAHAADRSSYHYEELAKAKALQAKYNRLTGVGKQCTLYFPVEKVSTKGYKAKSVEDALNQMERFFGGVNNGF